MNAQSWFEGIGSPLFQLLCIPQGVIWTRVKADVGNWRPLELEESLLYPDDDTPGGSTQRALRLLLCQIIVLIDVNKCQLDSIPSKKESPEPYMKILQGVDVM